MRCSIAPDPSIALIIAVVLLVALQVPAAQAQTFGDIYSQRVIRVAVLENSPPYSYRDKQGKRLGLEVDLAADVARIMGVGLKLVPVDLLGRVDALLNGEADLLIAGLSKDARLSGAVELLDPAYYAAGTNVITRKSEKLRRWTDLAGVPVCSIQGAHYNGRLTGDYGAELILLRSGNDALETLVAGKCRAFAFTDTALITLMRSRSGWSGYEIPLRSVDEVPWTMAIRAGDELLSATLSGIALGWHRDGKLLTLQKKWRLKTTGFVSDYHDIYRQ